MAVGGACLGWCCDEPGSSDEGSSDGSSQRTLPGCGPCLGGLVARYYMVELSGITVGSISGCAAECSALNGIYVVEITSAREDGCSGEITIPGACQDQLGGKCYRLLRLSFVAPTPSQGGSVDVQLLPLRDDIGAGECSTVAAITWRGDLSSPGQKLACLELNHAPLPFHSRTGVTLFCDPAGSTAYVTAL